MIDPPLTPDGDDARSLLRRELLHPEYQRSNVLQRLYDWLHRLVANGLERTDDASAMGTLVAMVLAVLLIIALAWLVSRVRFQVRARRTSAVVLTDESLTAAQIRARAELAFAEGRYDDALVDAFRATALGQIERDRIDNLPGATAHEVAITLSDAFPEQRGPIGSVGAWFDEVLYGSRPASRDQASAALALDDHLADHLAARR